MKSGWQSKKLRDLLNIQNGYAFDSGSFSASGDIGLIRIRDLKSGSETETKFTGAYEEKYVVNAGDFLIGMDGEFGCYEWKGAPALLNQRVCRLQDFDPSLSPRFLFHGVNSHLKAIEDVTSYTTVKHLSSRQILEIDFPLPPLPEQQRIVGILDEAFAGIATAKANAEKNLQNARALFESHLHAVFTHRGPGWVEKSLENCCEQIFAGGDVPKGRVSETRTSQYSVPIFANGAKDDGLYGYTDEARVTKPSITISARGTIGFTAIRTEPFLPVVRLIVLIPDERQIQLSLLNYALMGMDFGNTGTSIPQLTVPNLKERKVHLPPITEQQSITARLDALQTETRRLEALYARKLAALDELKAALLHQAFSGQL